MLRISNWGRAIRSLVCTSVPNSSENYDADSSKSPSQEAAFDTKLPRRSLMVQFTCDSCGERTKRLINRVAYKKGTVFLQICRRKVKPGLLRLRRYFTPPNLWFIKDMYDDYGLEMIKILHEDPAKALSVLLARLKKKKLELSILESKLEMTWRVSADRLFHELHGT